MQIQELDLTTEFEDEADAFIKSAEENRKPEAEQQQQEKPPDREAEIPEQFYANFLKDVENLAASTIEQYFSSREMHVGGPIPKSFLRNPDYITMILNTDICDGADRAYEALAGSDNFEESGAGIISDDIKLVVGLIHEIEREVPRAFVAGILLMHLELVEGVEI